MRDGRSVVALRGIHLTAPKIASTPSGSGRRQFSRGAAKFDEMQLKRVAWAASRSGSVFSDRYFPRALRTPTQVLNCIAYVLNNWKHHHESTSSLRQAWAVDPHSTASQFDGWRESGGQQLRVANGYDGPMIWWPKTWLSTEGWRRRGLISTDFVPGGDE